MRTRSDAPRKMPPHSMASPQTYTTTVWNVHASDPCGLADVNRDLLVSQEFGPGGWAQWWRAERSRNSFNFIVGWRSYMTASVVGLSAMPGLVGGRSAKRVLAGLSGDNIAVEVGTCSSVVILIAVGFVIPHTHPTPAHEPCNYVPRTTRCTAEQHSSRADNSCGCLHWTNSAHRHLQHRAEPYEHPVQRWSLRMCITNH